ncbi:hypothetical protein ACTL6P_01120 [Endozoicomonas acroporae]|uniref:hypothetical protein n=1 Tax=Endozoicomonas acroporae TaxID=1701104 RepID=UPI000C780EB6|nr:hypothetical protein [Endozoicomonas acroporae]
MPFFNIAGYVDTLGIIVILWYQPGQQVTEEGLHTALIITDISMNSSGPAEMKSLQKGHGL